MAMLRETPYCSGIYAVVYISINISSSCNLFDVDDAEICNTMKSIQLGLEIFFALVTCHHSAKLMICMSILPVSYSGAMGNALASRSEGWWFEPLWSIKFLRYIFFSISASFSC